MADRVAPEPPPAEGQTWQQQAVGGSNPDDLIAVVSPSGQAGTVRRADLAEAMDNGFRLEHPDEVHERKLEKAYGDRPIQTALESGLSTATFGLSDYLGGEGLRERRERNEGAALVGGIAGAFVPTGAGGLLSSAGRAVEGFAAKTLGKGLGGRVGAAGLRGAAEGVGYGVGAGVSQVALSEDPMTWEGAAATIGSNALGGALVGGGIGVAGKLLAEGATAAKAYANKQVEVLTKGEEAVDRSAFPDVVEMDQKAAGRAYAAEKEAVKARQAADITEGRAAVEAESANLQAQQREAASSLYDEAKAYKDFLKGDEAFVKTGDNEIAAMLGGSKARVMKGLNNRGDFVDAVVDGKGKKFLSNLRTQEEGLTRYLSKADEVFDNEAASQAAFLDALPRPKLPSPGSLDPMEARMVTTTAKELEERGLYELPGAGVDKTRMERVTADLGKPERFGDPIRLSMDDEGRFFINDGRHRLRALLAEGGERPLTIEVSMGSDATEAAVRLGGPSKTPFDKLVSGADEAIGKGKKFGFQAGEKLEARTTGLTPEQAEVYADFAKIELPKAGLAVTDAELNQFRAAVENFEVQMPAVKRMKAAEEVLRRNQALQARIAEVAATPSSPALQAALDRVAVAKAGAAPTPRLKALEAQLADLQEKKLGRTVSQAVGGSIGGAIGSTLLGPYIGGIGGAFIGRDIGNKFYDRFVRKLVANNAARGRSIKQAIAGMFGKGAEKVAKAMPQATKIIPAIQYASREQADGVLGPSKYQPSKNPTVNQFRERARELDSLTQPGPNGTYQVRQKALMDLHERMAGMWAISPGVANGIEKLQQAKWAFLASKLPRNPAPPHLQAGPDTWEASKPQMAKFARIMQVAENPEPAIRRVAAGTATPDDIETLKAIWPAHYEDVRGQCMDHIGELQRTLPYAQRLNLSILLDTPVDPALTPQALSVYQRPMLPPDQKQKPQAPTKPMPMGTVEPTSAQRHSQ